MFDLEQGFWTQRDSLQHIYLAALAHMCAPWAVLGYCAAMALALMRPHVVLPPIVGGPGSFNWFGAIAAKSGGGKSSSLAVAQLLVNQPVMQRNLGSGEGLVDAYVKPANKETGEPKGLFESIMFVAGEIDGMAVWLNRTGSMLGPNLRDGFSGQVIGTQNRTASDLHLQSHTYRMTLVANVQPGRAGALLDDTKSGMLQRFMWFPGIDFRVSSQVPDNPGSLHLPSHAAWQYPLQLEIPYEATGLIRDERERHMHGAGHALFIREKFAYALAVLDGRDDMTFDYWRLAGIASRVSDQTRGWVAAELEQARDDDSERRGRDIGVSQDEANVTRRRREIKRSSGIRKRVIDRMTEADQGRGISKREALQNFNGSERDIARAAFDQSAGEGVFVKLGREKGERTDRWVVSE